MKYGNLDQIFLRSHKKSLWSKKFNREPVNWYLPIFFTTLRNPAEKFYDIFGEEKIGLFSVFDTSWIFFQSTITCSKLAIETLKQGVKYVQS